MSIGSITLDGALSDWSASQRLDTGASGASGYEFYGTLTGGYYVFAIKAADPISAGSTLWLNTDRNTGTGYQIWGWAGGAEYNINFDASGTPRLYSGAAGQTQLAGAVEFARSADGRIVEFAVPVAALAGASGPINVYADINDITYLPNAYASYTYTVNAAPAAGGQYGAVTIDGAASDWTAVDRIDTGGGAASGYALYGKVEGGAFVLALSSAITIGAGTTFWFNTDGNTATGYKVWGWAVGAEFNLNFNAAGAPALYTNGAGETLLSGAALDWKLSADGRFLEFAIPTAQLQALLGAVPTTSNIYADVNDSVFVPTSYADYAYALHQGVSGPPSAGGKVLDGALGDWSGGERIDVSHGVSGYEVYGHAEGDFFVFALKAPVAIGAGTTAWLNTDLNAGTGYQIWGWAGGAEFNVNFDASGTPRLYTGDAGASLVSGAVVQYGYSADHKTIEFAVSKAALGGAGALNTLLDVNDTTFLPSAYAEAQYHVEGQGTALPPRTDFSKKVAIVYSETTAKLYSGQSLDQNMTAYGQMFMTAQSQAQAAGVPFDILTESDLTNLAKLAQYDAIVFPSFKYVKGADVANIAATLKTAVDHYHIGIITAGDFLSNDETGAALPGDAYANMRTLLDLTRVEGGVGPSALTAASTSHAVMQGYGQGELIRQYANAVEWSAYGDATPGAGASTTTLVNQTHNGVASAAGLANEAGGRNVHFATPAFMGDNNQLQHAIDWAVNGVGVTAGLQIGRQASVFASRNDMDFAQRADFIDPAGGPGLYEKLVSILADWKAAYNFVGSYYIDIGLYPSVNEQTDWAASRPFFDAMLAMQNEIGTHSYTHPLNTDFLLPATVTDQMLAERVGQFLALRGGLAPEIVQQLTTMGATAFNQLITEARAVADPLTLDDLHKAALETTIWFQFEKSREVIEANLGIDVVGAAVPGNPEFLRTSLEMIQYFDYLTGRASIFGGGTPGAFGYLTPDQQDKVYLSPNVSFDFTLVDFDGGSPAGALAAWQQEFAALMAHADVPVIMWPWHDYGPTEWVLYPPEPSHYTLEMYADFIAQAAAADSEFVTLADLAKRIASMEKASVTVTTSGSTVSASVVSNDAGKFALDLDHLGTQVIKSVAGWYAYDADSIFLPRNGGSYTIQLGAAQDDVTHIIRLPSRAELVSLSGDGSGLSFSLIGEGKLVIDLKAGGAPVVTGATVVSQVGELLTLDVGANGLHTVSITLQQSTNAAPVISSNGGGATAALNLAENLTAVTTVLSTDADAGQARSYSISGGADAARFAINVTTGALSFVAAADFEIPTDSDGNNVYNVIVKVTDAAGAFDTQALAVTVTNVAGQTLSGNNNANTLNGGAEPDTISGNGGVDTLNGLGGADTLNGGAANDTLNGGAGNDRLIGGAGFDNMTGGAGKDSFVFNAAIAEIGNGTTVTSRDVITDFTIGGQDRIDLSAIDANTNASGNQAFALLAAPGAAFTGAGQIRYLYQTISGVEHTIIEGNVNTNTAADFRLDLIGHITPTAADFVL